MRKQTVMFTALPNGFATAPAGGARLRLSVLVSPRLMTNEGMPKPKLSQFPDFLAWPEVPLSFAVRFEGGPVLAAMVVNAPPSPDLWRSLFKPATYVRPYSFPHLDNRIVRSFPAGHVMAFLKEEYLKVAKERPLEYPHVESIGNRQSFGQIGTYREPIDSPTHVPVDLEKGLQDQLNRVLEKSKAVPPSATPNPIMDFYQAKLFHRPRNANPIHVEVPELDFHQVVSSLGDYPEIMRRMGLVVDLEVPFRDTIPESARMQLVPSWSPSLAATEVVTPWTHYDMDPAGIFRAASRPIDPEIREGMLDLTDAAGYGVTQIDVDGAALKALDFANNLLRSQSRRYKTADTPDRMSLPAMRSAGLSLVRTGRAIRLVQTLEQSRQRNDAAASGAVVEFHAEDLTRGYRVDIWDSRSEVWHSVCRRRGLYRFTDGNLLVDHEDEGIVTMGLTQSSDESSSDLYLHESMLRWEGWSLAAPRPGKLIGTDDTAAEATNPAVTNFGLETHFVPAPRSLPRLRFGTTYRMRARAVDLAGNSAPPDLLDDSAATQPVQYGRFEPVASPAVLLRAEPTEGEAVERLVIRSNYDTPSAAGTERHVAPPRVAQLLAETHGMFDADSGVDKAGYGTIVGLEGVFNPDGIHAEEQLALPYLPDPLGLGATFLGLPGGVLTQVPFSAGDGWPGWLPFRVRVEEGGGAPQWDAVSRQLTVRLPKAEMVPVRISAYPGYDGLEQMGLWQWLKDAGLSPAHLNSLREVASRGAHWMLTPFRQLTLVHAVQQPLQPPQYQALKAEKVLGNTFATLKDTVLIHGKSTLKVDVLAQWEEPVDSLKEPAWRTITGRANAADVPVQYPDMTVALNHRHEFGDTKYRRVRYTGLATSRYKEYFQVRHEATVAVVGEAAHALIHTALVAHSETVQSADGTVIYHRDQDYRVDYEAGTITRVAGGGIADGASVNVKYAYLPGSVTREMTSSVTVDVLNSARPAAPKIVYVVPTFGWSREDLTDGVAIRRAGGGLRIYMERPWFSSGEGELLGAVLWSPPKPTLPIFGTPTRPPEALKPFVTQWGKDPIWLSGDTYTVPTATHFPRATESAGGLTLDEAPGTTFAVAGHKVGYDAERRLWYCDMEIDAGPSYFPFVRLALARFQPRSVQYAHLSRVVLADFAQLAPDRLATVIRDPSQPGLVAVTVCGPGYTSSAAGRGSSDMEVTVEQKRPDVAGDLGWVPALPSAFPLPLIDGKSKSLTWAGGVTLPESTSGMPLRLVIKEYERFVVDGAGSSITGAASARIERRLVYASVLEL